MALKRRKRWGRASGLVLLILGTAGYFILSSQSKSGLNQVLTDAKSAGMALTPEDLRAAMAVPVSQNAAPQYRDAFEVLRANRASLEAIENARSGRPKPTDIPVADAWVAVSSVFPLLKAATDKPHMDFDRKWELGPNLLLPEYAEAKQAVKLLLANSARLASQGKMPAAWDSLRQASVIGKHVGEEPTLIALLVQIAIEGIVGKGVTDLLEKHRDSASLDAAERVLDAAGQMKDLHRSLASEVIMARVALVDPKGLVALAAGGGFASPGIRDRAMSWATRVPLVRNQMEANALRHYLHLYRELPKDPLDWEKVDLAMSNMDKRVQSDKSLASYYTKIVTPVFSQCGFAIGRRLAEERALRILIESLREKNRTGAWPLTAPDLGVNSQDPFGNNPLIYRLSPGDLSIYSIGPNKRDDNATTQQAARSSAKPEDFDFVLRFPR